MMLSKDEIISNKKEINKNNKNIIKGVYFLINNNDLVYVGESQDIFNRIRSHSYLKTKRFNAFNFIIIDNDDDRKFTEYMYIDLYKPIYNKRNNYKKTREKCLKLKGKNNLKEIMTKEGITIQDLAISMNVSLPTICNYRKAETIKPKTQRKIAKALKVDVNVVFDV